MWDEIPAFAGMTGFFGGEGEMSVGRVSEEGVALIKRFEGFSACVYLCPAGKSTIGYGHVVRKGENFVGRMLSKEEAEDLLLQDVKGVETCVGQQVTAVLPQQAFDALVCLSYNIGCYAFEKSTLLAYLNAGKIHAAADEFRRWVFSGGQKLAGLEQRREAERRLFLRGYQL